MSAFEAQWVDESTLRLQGALGFATAATALAAGERMINAGSAKLQIDCAGLTHVDSAGLAVLLEWLAMAARRSRPIGWINLPESLRQLAAISEVQDWLVPLPGR
jgi:phospholipid transport system transporter-binding protein